MYNDQIRHGITYEERRVLGVRHACDLKQPNYGIVWESGIRIFKGQPRPYRTKRAPEHPN